MSEFELEDCRFESCQDQKDFMWQGFRQASMASWPATTDVRGPLLQWTMCLTKNQKIAGTVNTLTVWVTNCTVQTLDLILLCIRRVPQLHFWIGSKFLLRLLLCILGLFLQPNFTLSFHYPDSGGASVRIPSGHKLKYLYEQNPPLGFNTIHILWFMKPILR